MKVKKIISMLLVGVMALGLLAGCGSQTEESGDAAASEDDGGNTLVVY